MILRYQEVLDDVKKFSKEYDVKVKYDYNSLILKGVMMKRKWLPTLGELIDD